MRHPLPSRAVAAILLLTLLAPLLSGCLDSGPAPDPTPAPAVEPPPETVMVEERPVPVPRLKVTVTERTAAVLPTLETPTPIHSWNLDWGDKSRVARGGGVLPERLTHDYRTDGRYTITFTVIDPDRIHYQTTTDVFIGRPEEDGEARYAALSAERGVLPFTAHVLIDKDAIRAADKSLARKTESIILAWAVDPGDGSDVIHGTMAPPDVVQHTYTRVGTYAIRINVTTANGNDFITWLEVTVTPPTDIVAWSLHNERPFLRATGPDGTRLGGLHPDGDDWHARALTAHVTRLIVLLTRGEGEGALWVVDRTTGRDVALYALPDRPATLQNGADGRVWVTHDADTAVTVIDPEDGNQTRITLGLLSSATKLILSRDGTTGFAVQADHGGNLVQLDPTTHTRRELAAPAGQRTQAIAYNDADRVLALLDADSGDIRLHRKGTFGPLLHGAVDLPTDPTVRPVDIACHSTESLCWALHQDRAHNAALLTSIQTRERLQGSPVADPTDDTVPGTNTTRFPDGARAEALQVHGDRLLIVLRTRQGHPLLAVHDITTGVTTEALPLDPDAPRGETRLPLRIMPHPEHPGLLYWQDDAIGRWGLWDLDGARTVNVFANAGPHPVGFHIAVTSTR
ncbi:MAG: PKD domain-containing protein [Euryarchaeota archaeon]|nr:PKD domain-containing protein [Euryarchaeota archaeon]